METVNFDRTLKLFCGISGVPILLVLASCILTGSIVHGYYKEVDYSGSTKIVNQGDPFQIVCRLSKFHKLQWMKNETPLSPDESSNGYLQIEEYDENNNQEIYTLRVKHAEPKHAGIYRCSSFSRDSHKLEVISLGYDDKISKFVVEPGETLELKCGIPDTIAPRAWFKDGVKIVGSSIGKEIRGDSLIINNVEYTDAGTYNCTLEDNLPVTSWKGPFHVYFRTKVVPFPSEKVYLPGQNLTLSCNVYGYPVPSIRWYIGNIPVETEQNETDDRISILPDKETGHPSGVLQIINLNEGDTKLYTCLAKNIFNEDESSVKVIVQAIVMKSALSTTIVPQDGKFTLTCHVPLTGMYLWLKDGVPVMANTANNIRLEQEYPSEGNNASSLSSKLGLNNYVVMKLIVDKADAKLHSGEYKCGRTSPTSRRIVVVMENMIRTNADIDTNRLLMNPGKTLQMYCNVTNHPDWEVEWFKNGLPINETDKVKKYTENNTLVIKRAMLDDAGNYSCVVTRDTHTISANIDVVTNAIIQVALPKSMNLVQGDRLLLYCNATGVPQPSITWFKGNELINSTHGRIKLEEDELGVKNAKLIIEQLDFDDRDFYTCEADNGIGTANSTIMVRVKDRLAALWPFLGIVAEVIVLCTIIFIYEKKRVKPDFDESDNDQATDNKSVPDQRDKGQEVRQRK